jgi:starvation-inducible DNA-binding protein
MSSLEVTTMTMTIEKTAQPEGPAQGMVAHDLARLLADTYALYLKTHGYHWNVTGPHFRSLHLMFEEHYTELATAVDEIAERIRTLGPMAPGSYREMAALASVSDEEGAPAATEMVRRLIAAHEVVAGTARAVVDAAEKTDDPASLDLATRRIAVHEKTRWMLRATLEEGGS